MLNPEIRRSNVAARPLEGWPDLRELHRLDPARYPCLFESVSHGTHQARYDILFAFPGDQINLRTLAESQGDGFLARFDEWWRRERLGDEDYSGLPFSGGWFVYLGYELAGEIEATLRLPMDSTASDDLPIAVAVRCPAAIIRDHQTRRCILVAETDSENLLSDMHRDLGAMGEAGDTPVLPHVEIVEDDPARFLSGVERIKRYIYEGDVFQVNLSRAWQARFDRAVDGADLYAHLCRRNPAPFAGVMRLGDTSVVSSSPERLVSMRHDVVQTRPIAGTHPRDRDRQIDAQLSQALMLHPKERAEHIMLIDLERNDLGRVCVPGTVRVDELMALESYRHVHHIVSNIYGRRRPEVTPGQIMRAVFPGGTITGCPKVRCMEIIAELEQGPRGAYTGALGYVNRDGSMDLNILIRTLTLADRRVSLRAGAGIVADSVPMRELEETRAKARGLLEALS